MISDSSSSRFFNKTSHLQIQIRKMMNLYFPSALALGVVSSTVLYGAKLQAATLYFETDRIQVTEPQTGSRLVSIRPIVTFGAYNNDNSADIAAWDYMENTSSPCIVTGSVSINEESSSATVDEDYRNIESSEFSLATSPYFDENDQIRFDDVSQEVLFEVMADNIEESEEHVELEFSDLSVTCAEGSFNLTSANYGSTTISITPAEVEPTPLGPKPIPLRQKSLAAQFNSVRSLSLQTANARNRSLSRELNNARKQRRKSRNNLQVKIDGKALVQPLALGAGAGDALNDLGRWGFFLTGNIDIGTQKDSGSTSLDYNSSQLIAGVDYRIANNLVLGSAISMTIADMGSKSFAKTDLRNSALSLFGSYYSTDSLYIDAILTTGLGDYDFNRKIETTGNNTETAYAKTDSNETGASIGTGYNFIDHNKNFRLFTLINYVDVNIDGYTESVTGNSSAASVTNIDLQSLTLDLGFEGSWNINTATGVYSPLVSIAFVHQYMDDAVDISGHFLDGPDQGGFYFSAADRDDNYLNAQLGISGVFKNGVNAYFTYDTDLARKDLSSKRYSIGFRWQY